MIKTLSVAGYRSLKDLTMALAPLSVITGGNGTGKSNVFKALGLLKAASQGRFAETLAGEGGLPGVLFAGPESVNAALAAQGIVEGVARRRRVELRLGLAFDDLHFELTCGLPPQQDFNESFFTHDPDIKSEHLWLGKRKPSSVLAERKNARVIKPVGLAGTEKTLDRHESMLWQVADTAAVPEFVEVRQRLRALRLYHGFATHAGANTRLAGIGFYSPALFDDGSNLASAIATIFEIGDASAFHAAIDQAFPGASLRVERDADARFHLRWKQFGLLRELSAAELSDGTLRYMCLLAALHAPHPPEVYAFNEPETSLYPELLQPLARQFKRASAHSQVIVISHAMALVDALEDFADARVSRLTRTLGVTQVEGVGILDQPSWP